MLTKWGKVITSINNYSDNPSFGRNNRIFPNIRSTPSNMPAFIEAKTIAGTVKYCSPSVASSGSMITNSLKEGGSSSSSPSLGVAIGSGNTAPTVNDYTLENQITGFTVGSPTYTTRYDAELNKYIVDVAYVVTNNTGAQITINEIGTFVTGYMTDDKGSVTEGKTTTNFCIMVDRTVLEEEIAIPNTEAGIVVYTFAYGTDYE